MFTNGFPSLEDGFLVYETKTPKGTKTKMMGRVEGVSDTNWTLTSS